VRYSPFGELTLTARARPGVPRRAQLPSYAKIREAEAAGGQEPVRLAFTLVEGARWTAHTKVSAGPFDLGETAWVASEDGLAVHTLRPTDGSPMEVRALPAITDRIRALGRSPSGGLWLLVGLRSFLLAPEGGTPWQFQTSGRLERAPAVAENTMLLADDTGILAGLDPTKGTRAGGDAHAAPAQSPVATPIGFLLTTASGDVVVVNPKDGKTSVLVPGAARRAGARAVVGRRRPRRRRPRRARGDRAERARRPHARRRRPRPRVRPRHRQATRSPGWSVRPRARRSCARARAARPRRRQRRGGPTGPRGRRRLQRRPRPRCASPPRDARVRPPGRSLPGAAIGPRWSPATW
jgi:hypothetical protein